MVWFGDLYAPPSVLGYARMSLVPVLHFGTCGAEANETTWMP